MLGARIGPTSPLAPLRGNFRGAASLLVAALLAGCAMLGAEITVDARNESDHDMIVQVVDANGMPHGPGHRLFSLEERAVELALPGGAWAVTVNGAVVVESEQAEGRTGRLPLTLVSPAPDDPAAGPYVVWELPGS